MMIVISRLWAPMMFELITLGITWFIFYRKCIGCGNWLMRLICSLR